MGQTAAMGARVLIVSATLIHGHSDPRTIRARRLIGGLGERGFAVDAVSWWDGAAPAPPPPGAEALYALPGPSPLGEPELTALDRWAAAARERIAGLEPQLRPDLVYAIGYPLGALVAGAGIAAAAGAPLVCDLGDPWIADTAAGRERRERTLGAAAGLVVANERLAENLGAEIPPAAPVLVAPGGGELRRRTGRRGPEPPLFVQLGAINPGRVDPAPTYQVLARLHERGELEFRSHATGWHPGIDALPHPHLPLLDHAEAIELTAEATAAIVLGNQGRDQVPSKAFEIACTETWALCVSELADDPAVAVLEASGHAVAARNEPEAIESAAREIIGRAAAGRWPHPDPGQGWASRIDSIAALLRGILRG